jgi:hypothetical protein
LLEAKGVTANHVLGPLMRAPSGNRMNAIRGVRKKLRGVLGPEVTFRHLFPESVLEYMHGDVIADDVMTRWALESSEPLDKLWLAAGSVDGALRGCRLVKKAHDADWIYNLPVTAPGDQLRRLALHFDDDKATAWVRDHLLGDPAMDTKWIDDEAAAPPTGVLGGGERERLDEAVAGEPEQIIARLADLPDGERAALLKQPDQVRTIAAALPTPSDVERLVIHLQPTIKQLLMLGLGPQPRLMSYLRTRPPVEERAAVIHEVLTTEARTMFGTSPFVVFPSLEEPAALAQALEKNPDLLIWMLEEADGNRVLVRLSRDPVREKAVALFEAKPDLLRKLPRHKNLLEEGAEAFATLRASFGADELRETGEAYEQGSLAAEDDAKEEGTRVAKAAKKSELAEALVRLEELDGKEADARALLDHYPSGQVALANGDHPEALAALRAMAPGSPIHLFPQLGIDRLIWLRGTGEWLLESEGAMVFHLVSGNAKAMKSLAKLLDDSPMVDWISSLPQGAGLTDVEEQVLDAIRRSVSSPAVLGALFKMRFGTPVESEEFNVAEMQRIWDILIRLPEGHVDQERIATINKGPIAGGLGMWKGEEDELLLHSDLATKGSEAGYETDPEMTAEEVKKQYALDDAGFEQALQDKWIVESAVKGRYRVAPTMQDLFDATVLHEVGHSVDEILGSRTELVFGLAGWKTYAGDDLESWARDLGGGFDRIPAKKRREILEVWHHVLRSGMTVKELVPDDHPALDPDYADVPLIERARAGGRFADDERYERGGRMWLFSGGTPSSLLSTAVDAAPSQYSLTAPAEYFAECYAEYYRLYDGIDDAKKGGRLAAWIKKWFDENVDKIQFDPQRLEDEKTAEPPAPDQPKRAGS